MNDRQKQIRRIKQAIRRNNKKGYAIAFDDLVNDTLSINDLKNITPQHIRDRAEYKVDPTTGELEYINESFFTIDMQSDFIIEQFRENISRYFPGKNDVSSPSDYINNWLDDLIHDQGKEKVANLLTESKNQGLWVSPEEFYKMGSTYEYIYMLDSLFDDIDSNNFNGEIWENDYYD